MVAGLEKPTTSKNYHFLNAQNWSPMNKCPAGEARSRSCEKKHFADPSRQKRKKKQFEGEITETKTSKTDVTENPRVFLRGRKKAAR